MCWRVLLHRSGFPGHLKDFLRKSLTTFLCFIGVLHLRCSKICCSSDVMFWFITNIRRRARPHQTNTEILKQQQRFYFCSLLVINCNDFSVPIANTPLYVQCNFSFATQGCRGSEVQILFADLRGAGGFW